jgi:hypothetical protein
MVAYLEFIGLFNDHFQLGMLSQDGTPQFCNAPLLFLFAGQRLLVITFLWEREGKTVNNVLLFIWKSLDLSMRKARRKEALATCLKSLG